MAGAEGAKAIAAGLSAGSAVLKNIDTRQNNISGEAAQQLAAAALGSASLEVLSEVPIKELREDKHRSLDLSEKGLGPTEGIVLAELTKVSGVFTELSVANNYIGSSPSEHALTL